MEIVSWGKVKSFMDLIITFNSVGWSEFNKSNGNITVKTSVMVVANVFVDG